MNVLQFRDDMDEDLVEIGALAQRQRDAATEPSAGKVHNVLNQLRGTVAAAQDMLDQDIGGGVWVHP